MENYILYKSEAIEIFMKIVAKLKGIKLSDVESNDKVYKYLEEFKSEEVHIAKNEIGKSKYSRILIDLSSDIRKGLPVILSKTQLMYIEKFLNQPQIDKDGNVLNLEDYKINLIDYDGSKTSPMKLNDDIKVERKKMLQKHRWALYYYDEYYDGNKIRKIKGIGRAIIHFKPFGKVTIINYRVKQRITETYIGRYYIYEAKFLRCELITEQGNKDLHIRLDIGQNDNFEIALGQYHNLGREISSGTVLLKELRVKGGIKPDFFDYENKNNEISEIVWEFFKNRERNLIETPLGINSELDLNVWLENQK